MPRFFGRHHFQGHRGWHGGWRRHHFDDQMPDFPPPPPPPDAQDSNPLGGILSALNPLHMFGIGEAEGETPPPWTEGGGPQHAGRWIRHHDRIVLLDVFD